MAHRRHRRQDPFVSQSAQEAVVRYGPETSALNELRREAIETAQTSVRAARSAGADVRRSVGAAGPPIRAAYGQALSTASQQAGIAASDLAGMPANSPFRAAAALEQTGLAGRLGESQAAALTDLSRRRVAAAEGTRSAVGAARSTLADALMKVANRRIDLAREQGAFTASEAQQLRTEARKEAETLAIAQGRLTQSERSSKRSATQSERNSQRSAGIDPDTGKPIPGGPLTRGRGGRSSGIGDLQTHTAHSSFASDVHDIASYAQRYAKSGLSRDQIAEKLQRGRSGQTVLVDKNGNPLPEGLSGAEKQAAGAHKVALPRIPQFANDLRMQAALDIALTGHVSKRTQMLLHRQGYSVNELGFTSAGQYVRRHRPHLRGTTGNAPAVGGSRPG